jgi:integrase
LRRYHATLAEMAATGLPAPAKSHAKDLTVAEALERFLEHAKTYYATGEGAKNGHISRIKAAVKGCVDLYSADLASEFGPLKLRAVQAELVRRGYTRGNVNNMTGVLKLAWKWLAANELVPAPAYLALTVVSGLRVGKTAARESEPVRPVPQAHIDAVREVLPPTVRSMVDLQLATGARPGEIVRLRPCDIDRSGPVWVATLKDHKTAYHGKERTLYMGPKAQAAVRELLLTRGPADYLFNPREAIQQRGAAAETHRRKGQPETPRKTKRTISDRYDVHSYRRAIARAVATVNKKAEEEKTPKISNWHPHQLRHNAGTAVRGQFGLDGAQVYLGHSDANVTQIYSEIDRAKALKIAEEMG